MPRYFFDLADGSRDPDLTGTELQGPDVADREAIRFLGELLKHEPRRLDAGTLRVEVREDGDDLRTVVAVTVERPSSTDRGNDR